MCGNMPTVAYKTVVLCAEAAYAGECLKYFTHTNIAGDHVSNGIRYKGTSNKQYKGTSNKRNTGAFVYAKGKWRCQKFCLS